jgi:putative endonuclease
VTRVAVLPMAVPTDNPFGVPPSLVTAYDGHWCVYLLRLQGGSLYCGCTNDLARRLATHAAGRGSRLMRARLPFTAAYFERVPEESRSAAQKREAALKALTKLRKEELCAAWMVCAGSLMGR